MPELPEVETIVRQLRETALNKKFWGFESKHKSTVQPNLQVYEERLQGARILDITRRGKFIIFILDNKMRLVIHLRMTGRLMWEKEQGRGKYIRAIFKFSDGTRLYFSDVRKFGRIWLAHEDEYEKLSGIAKLGPEPLAENFTVDQLTHRLQNKTGALKNNLLNQENIAGIGNIYADEIAHRIKIHPTAPLKKLKPEHYKLLHEAIIYCLSEGIKHCGVTLSDFVGTNGKQGEHQKYLKIYGREGQKCHNCKTIIQKIRAAGRGTFFCPQCQINLTN